MSDIENSPQTNEDDEAALAVARTNLIGYACAMKDNYAPGRHHYYIAALLTRLMEGKIKRAIISLAPQHGKSEEATQLFPSYYFGHHPEQSIIVGGYGQDKADDFGRATKSYMDSEIYSALFPGTQVSAASDSIRRFQTTAGGHYYAVGIGAGVTGRGANGLILDDPYKNREEADSETRTETIINWWKSTFRTRLRGDGWILVIQTRWNKRDLIQYLLDNPESDDPKYHYKYFNLAALIEDETDAASDPLKRKVGEALWPEVFPPDVLLRTKNAIGSRDWNALYQGRPSDAQGEIFLRNWWKYWCRKNCTGQHDHHYLPEKFDDAMQVWDCAFKDAATSDFVVGLAGKRSGANLYVMDRWKNRANVKKTCDGIREFTAKHPDIPRVGIEDKANGPAVISTIKDEISGVIAIPAEGSKESRWNAAAPAVESGNVYLPYGAPWVEDFIEVCASVPHGKYDDDADAVAYLILKLIGSRLSGMLDWMKEQVNKMLAKKQAA